MPFPTGAKSFPGYRHQRTNWPFLGQAKGLGFL